MANLGNKFDDDSDEPTDNENQEGYRGQMQTDM